MSNLVLSGIAMVNELKDDQQRVIYHQIQTLLKDATPHMSIETFIYLILSSVWNRIPYSACASSLSKTTVASKADSRSDHSCLSGDVLQESSYTPDTRDTKQVNHRKRPSDDMSTERKDGGAPRPKKSRIASGQTQVKSKHTPAVLTEDERAIRSREEHILNIIFAPRCLSTMPTEGIAAPPFQACVGDGVDHNLARHVNANQWGDGTVSKSPRRVHEVDSASHGPSDRDGASSELPEVPVETDGTATQPEISALRGPNIRTRGDSKRDLLGRTRSQVMTSKPLSTEVNPDAGQSGTRGNDRGNRSLPKESSQSYRPLNLKPPLLVSSQHTRATPARLRSRASTNDSLIIDLPSHAIREETLDNPLSIPPSVLSQNVRPAVGAPEGIVIDAAASLIRMCQGSRTRFT